MNSSTPFERQSTSCHGLVSEGRRVLALAEATLGNDATFDQWMKLAGGYGRLAETCADRTTTVTHTHYYERGINPDVAGDIGL